METSLNFIEFSRVFATRDACLQFLYEKKWSEGYCCRKCGHTTAIKGRAWYHKRCRQCYYDESCTAHTLFHKIKFSIEKAFLISYQVSTFRKGISTMEISRQYQITQKTAWFFKRKVQEVLTDNYFGKTLRKPNPANSSDSKLIIEVDLEYSKRGRKGKRTIQRSYVYIKSLPRFWNIRKERKSHLIDCLQTHQHENSCCIRFTDSNGRDIGGMHHLQNLKHWLKGVHHQISLEHLQRYLDEFNFRYNQKGIARESPLIALRKMALSPWLPYRQAVAR